LQSDVVSYQLASAQDLPFADASFDLVVCQFGVMFFPDKVLANREVRRVLKLDGHYLFITFDRLDLNPVPKAASEAVAALFPESPPDYMLRGPFSYTEPAQIERDLVSAGFKEINVERVVLKSRVNVRDAALGLIFGSPFRSEIESRDPSALERVAGAVTQALTQFDGRDTPVSAHLVRAGC
jgi:SAM-dependent methyltransferase